MNLPDKLLFVDLSSKRTWTEKLSEKIQKDFLGGSGLGIRVLFEKQEALIDPLAEKNMLGFFPGLLSGTGTPFSGRLSVVTKSPLTGCWAESNCGGHIGPEIALAGYGGIIFQGISETPCYVHVEDTKVEIKDAKHVWGLDTIETEKTILNELGKKGKGAWVLCIGPAGEKKSLIAGIVTEGMRIAARGGVGAVMGSKNLKALIVKGTQKIVVQNPEELKTLNKDFRERFKGEPSLFTRIPFKLLGTFLPTMRRLKIRPQSGPTSMVIHTYKEWGTSYGVEFSTELGDAPVKNWSGVGHRDFPDYHKIGGTQVKLHEKKKYHCRNCPVGCGGIVSVSEGNYPLENTRKPEFETLTGFGGLNLNSDLFSIIKLNDICNRFGMDVISVATSLSFAIECMEKGIITREETGGIDLKWGNPEGHIELVTNIGKREGFGEVLADGVKKAVERLDKEGIESLAIHAGGQELPLHDPKWEPTLGVAYEIDPAPGRHTTWSTMYAKLADFTTLYPQFKNASEGEILAEYSKYWQVVKSLGLCQFALFFGRPPILEWINATTGWELSMDNLLVIGERIQTLRRMFNLREGMPLQQKLPKRAIGDPPLDVGPLKGKMIDTEPLIREYCEFMSWDPETGIPDPERLRDLGLDSLMA